MSRWYARTKLAFEELSRWPGFWAAVLLVSLIGAAITSVRLGAVAIPTAELWPSLTQNNHPLHTVLWQIRLPRVVVAMLVGAALAVAGALLQTAVRNPLADPGLLGINAGAGVAFLLALIFYPNLSLMLPLVAFLGAQATVMIILLAAWGPRRRLGPLKIILSGVAIQTVLFSVIALISFFFADRAPAFVAFTVGSLNGAGWPEARMIAGPIALGLLVALVSRRQLNLLLLDDRTALGIGLEVQRARFGSSALAALLAACAVSVAGLVGFVGLVVPNWVRIVSGPDHRTLIPLSALAGAVLVVLADLVARIAAAPLEVPVGALLALVGGPCFLFVRWIELP